MLSLISLSNYFVFISFIASLLIYNKKGTPVYLKLFSWFLLITIIVEILSLYLWNKEVETFKLYNFFTVFEFCFYLFIISKILSSVKARKTILYTIFIYLIISVINILFFQKDSFHSITYSLGCLLIVTACIYYFLELFQYPKSITLIK